MSKRDSLYIPLHIHSDYSIKDGLESVEQIVKHAKKFNIPALAITDYTNICGYIKFYLACKKAGIKPILGADIELVEESSGKDKEHRFSLTVLAMDRAGKQNLYDLISEAWLRSDPSAFAPFTTLEDLAKYSEGLILLNGFRGDIAYYASLKDSKAVDDRIGFYLKHYGDRFCFEITRTGRQGESEFENTALNLCMKHKICPVATNDTVFLYGPEDVKDDGFSDYDIHDIRVSIYRGTQRGDKDNALLYSQEQYLKSPDKMRELFADIPEAIYNTMAIAERCNVELMLDTPCLPHYPTDPLSASEYLNQVALNGLLERLEFLYPDRQEFERRKQEYIDRLNEELEVINNMDFAGYFLIVMEFIQWSKDNGVPVGPGRGSGGGSLVAYALKITDFDPIQFDLLFERFLNKERISMPDFDIDFCQRKREMTLTHVKERYGSDAFAQIATFGTLAPKAAIKDAGRVMGMTYGATDSVASKIPNSPGITFNKIFGIGKDGSRGTPEVPEFVNLYEQAILNDDTQKVDLINVAMRLEGVIRNIGKHAAGVVIAPTRTAEFSPLMVDKDGNTITQFDKKDVEHAGLVKFDFLGLTTLTIISDALEMINRKRAKLGQGSLDVSSIPYSDPASFKLIQQGDSTAVFQLESQGMRNLIKKMKPDRLDDLIALVALYRPGPLESGMVDHFVDRKHGREKVSYPQPDFEDLDLKPILDSTYGVIVYQEQVMQIAQVLAGYSLGGADILRRAMGKKNPAEMASQRGVFREGAIKKGKDPEIAMKIFDQIERFAEYGFNKSHSAAYALIAWWTLYLKTHYPAEFLASMMTADKDKAEKLVSYIANCARFGVKVNPPDVTEGKYSFDVDDSGSVIFGIGAIKGVGEDLANYIVHERSQGQFQDFFDFVKRVGPRRLNHKSLEALIFSGALDKLGPDRATMFESIDIALKYANQAQDNTNNGQLDLFADLSDTKPSYAKAKPWGMKTILHFEQKVLGLFLSGHPINVYLEEIRHFSGKKIEQLTPGTMAKPNEVTVCGVVMDTITKTSRKDNSQFYVLLIDDGSTQLEVSLFGDNAAKFKRILDKKDNSGKGKSKDIFNIPTPIVLFIRGTLYEDGEQKLRFRAKDLISLENKRRSDAKNITLKLSTSEFEENAGSIRNLMEKNCINVDMLAVQQGRTKDAAQSPSEGCTLNIVLDDSVMYLRNLSFRFDPTDEFIDNLRKIAGDSSVSIDY